MTKLDIYGNCPSCRVSWCGGDIPKKSREHYAPPYKWSRVIGVEDPMKYDGISYYKCPDCKAMFDRWTGELVELD